jgi:hypothetical protein
MALKNLSGEEKASEDIITILFISRVWNGAADMRSVCLITGISNGHSKRRTNARTEHRRQLNLGFSCMPMVLYGQSTGVPADILQLLSENKPIKWKWERP